MKLFKKKPLLKKIIIYFILIIHLFYSYSFANKVFSSVFFKKNSTKIYLQSIKKLKYYYFILPYPKRIIFDIQKIKINKNLKNLEKKINFSHNPYLKSIKIRQFNKKKTRFILKIGKKNKFSILNYYPNMRSNYKNKLIFIFYSNKKNIKPKKIKRKKIIHKQNKKKIIIMIDPGHGGFDTGAIGKFKTLEKNITLKIALELKKIINNNYKMQAFSTRYKDYFLPLNHRIKKTHKKKAQLFISIHTNAFKNIQAKGSSVFIFSHNKKTYLIKKKKKFTLTSLKSETIDNTKSKLNLESTINESSKFGSTILQEIKKINNLHKKSVCSANFAVLKNKNIPSVLIETAFISNPKEELKLKTKKFQKKIAKSIFYAIKIYLKNKNKKLIKKI